MIYFTELQNLPIYGVKGEFLGKLEDVCVDPNHKAARVASYLVRTPQKSLKSISYTQIQSISVRAGQTSVPRDELKSYEVDEGFIRIKKDVLDQQIIDVDNRKVVRVNDVDLDIEPTDGHSELRIVAVNVGLAAAVRRLLQGTMAKHNIRLITKGIPTRTIQWEFVNLIEADPARRVKLRISYDRLAELHPADIADILEDLSYNEQKAVIESLDDETAAHALSEIPTKMQADLLESIPTGKAADIVEEMPPDEAADVLNQLSPETSAEVLADMEKDEAEEVRELLGFEENTAGSMMTTEYVVVHESATVEGAIEALRNFEGHVENIHQIYMIDDEATLKGAVALGRVALADANTPLGDLTTEPPISAQAEQSVRSVVDLFHKYNLMSLPVIDEDRHLLGIVTADDVLELVINRK
ncbi:MAG: CBS domain-containing protein [Acidobacteriota bacterium]|nr:CBS domain-containing protein [Acidobacteriota bacterium]